MLPLPVFYLNRKGDFFVCVCVYGYRDSTHLMNYPMLLDHVGFVLDDFTQL